MIPLCHKHKMITSFLRCVLKKNVGGNNEWFFDLKCWSIRFLKVHDNQIIRIFLFSFLCSRTCPFYYVSKIQQTMQAIFIIIALKISARLKSPHDEFTFSSFIHFLKRPITPDWRPNSVPTVFNILQIAEMRTVQSPSVCIYGTF